MQLRSCKFSLAGISDHSHGLFCVICFWLCGKHDVGWLWNCGTGRRFVMWLYRLEFQASVKSAPDQGSGQGRYAVFHIPALIFSTSKVGLQQLLEIMQGRKMHFNPQASYTVPLQCTIPASRDIELQ